MKEKRVKVLISCAVLVCLSSFAVAEEGLPPHRVVSLYITGDDSPVREVKLKPNGQTCPVHAADATRRQRLVDLAALQWEHFGFPVYDISSRIPNFFPGDDTFELVDPSKNPTFKGAMPRMLRIGKKEDAQDIDATIGSFWASTPHADYFLERQNNVWKAAATAGWADAWSAAFISWVMCEAGLTTEQFQRAATHWTYIDQAIQGTGLYKAEDIEAAGIPEPGDLICADRAKEQTYQRVADRKLGTPRPLHCDLVVKTDWPHNRVFAIGGNVLDSVSLTAIRITKTGQHFHIERTPHRQWFAVLKLQTGGTADLEKAPLKIWKSR